MTDPGCTVHKSDSPTLHCDQPVPAEPRNDGARLCARHAALFPDRKPRAARPRCNGYNVRWTAGADRPVPCTAYADASGFCRSHRASSQ